MGLGRINEIKKYYSELIDTVDKVEDNYFRIILYYSLIDSFAQEYSNFNKNTSESFRKFISDFNTDYYFLNSIDPIYMYYDNFSVFEKNGFDINNYLSPYSFYTISEINNMIPVNEMKNILLQNGMAGEKILRYGYLSMLYKMRSKLVHELSNPAGFGKMDVKSNEPKCVFITVIGIAEYWKWVIPASFIRELLIHTMNNYLEYCLKKDRDPFENNIQSQRELLSKW